MYENLTAITGAASRNHFPPAEAVRRNHPSSLLEADSRNQLPNLGASESQNQLPTLTGSDSRNHPPTISKIPRHPLFLNNYF